MAVTTTKQVILTLAFKDATSRNFKFTGVDNEALPDVKDKILAINADMPSTFATTFVSNGGASCVMIRAAQIITINEEVIYSVAT